MVVTGGYMLKYLVYCSVGDDYMLVTPWLHVGYRFNFALQKPMYALSICERTKQNIFISIRVFTHCQPQLLPVWQNKNGSVSLTSLNGILCVKANIFQRHDMMSVSRSSRVLYLPTKVKGSLAVAKKGIVFSFDISMSVT